MVVSLFKERPVQSEVKMDYENSWILLAVFLKGNGNNNNGGN